ncbi:MULTISPECIES: hypothetical protein [unclassified Moraxella]|uniref:hypothetical protein n=1 Tax=unclassified Moraxella TaxID=2685852 RepID=UPI003AF7F72F
MALTTFSTPVSESSNQDFATKAVKVDDYVLLVDKERLKKALDSGFVDLPKEVSGSQQIHEFLLAKGKQLNVI